MELGVAGCGCSWYYGQCPVAEDEMERRAAELNETLRNLTMERKRYSVLMFSEDV